MPIFLFILNLFYKNKATYMSTQSTFGENKKCSICQLSEIDNLNYGEILCNKDLSVHLFCLYFSTYLLQRGKSNSGIVGFELRDIRKLIKNSIQNQCCYCHKNSATIYCRAPNCERVFHQICGFKANARFEYLHHFNCYCDLHNQIDESDELVYPKEFYGCWICYEELGSYHPVKTVPSCCNKWFHQQCLRRYAINAGYAFMCPLCRDKNYGDFARRHGIYVPEYEALWEKTHDFTDIERFYSRCDSKNCQCPHGSTFTNSKWIIKLCTYCGSYGLHTLCRPENECTNEIICDVCFNVRTTQTTTDHVNKSQTPQIATNDTNASRREIDIVVDLTNEDIVIDLTNEDKENNIFEENIRSDDDISETLEEKRLREKAQRPERNEMRQFRINLLFR